MANSPLSVFNSADSRRLRSSPPSALSGPWHFKQCSANSGLMSRLKSISAENAGADNAMHAKLATKVVQTRKVETERIVLIMVVLGRVTLDGSPILLQTNGPMFAIPF